MTASVKFIGKQTTFAINEKIIFFYQELFSLQQPHFRNT
jgi:hypothetical protein